MATLTQIYSLVEGYPDLKQRFLAARLKAAWDILNEAVNTENHANRLIWANWIISNLRNNSDSEYARFLSNTTIQTNGVASTDNDIQFVVNGLINTNAI